MADEAFQRRAAAHIQSSFPDQANNCADLKSIVHQLISRARLYGLEWESSLLSFVSLAFALGPRFDQHPKVNAVLMDTGIFHGDRVPMLLAALSPDDWDEVELFARSAGA